MAKCKYMGWLDLETTGLEEREGIVLEVGVAVTRVEFPFELINARSWVVKPSDNDWQKMMVPKVVEMHTKTGLITDVDFALMGVGAVEESVVNWLNETCGKKSTVMLCGSGVTHFDRRWLKFHMPVLEDRFNYQTLDVGVIRRAFSLSGGPDPKFWGLTDGTMHRALDDVLDHLEEWRQYATLMNPQPKEN